MRRLRSFLALPPLERRALIEAILLVTLIQLVLGRVPFRVLGRLVAGDVATGRGARLDGRLPEVAAWAVTTASRRAPGRTTCLTQALGVQALLARHGYASQLRFGVVRSTGGEVDGHAWVECEGRILIGGTRAEISRYTPLAVFDVERAFPWRTHATLQGGR